MKLKTVIVCFLAALPWPAAAQTLDPQTVGRLSAADVQAAAARIRPIVQDSFATEAALASARRDLQLLAARADALAAGGDLRKDAPGPLAAAQLDVRNLMAAVDGKLGSPAVRTSSAGTVRARFPVPDFEDGRLTRDLAEALRRAQAVLSEQLRKSPADAQRAEDLLVDLVVAEERLAWEAGWPFTREEAAELKGLAAEYSKVKDQAGKTAAGGRMEIGPLNDLDRRVGEAYARRRARGVSAINAQLGREAESNGRTMAAPFVIHRPTTRAGQRAVDARLAEQISKDIGVPVQPAGPALLLLANGTKPFDEIAAEALRGDR